MSLNLGSYPDFLPAFRVFLGQAFSGLRLTAFISVVSDSSALLVFNFFPVSYLMYFHGYHSFAPAPLLNILGFYAYKSYRPLARVVSHSFTLNILP